ncbi:hypothetical protein WA026_020828 [Henosepilachna vigintioctopunctata]|uniref:Uncharacterized protein n=1 Tax=Henosepilachna vigintioctopunctata TaxID=420089 RepID=A0AAW1TXH8_9CUCU
MNIFRYGIVVLLCFSLGATINEIEMKFDGRISTCSTTEIFALTAENLTYNQLKAIQENHIKNNDDYLRCNLGDDDLCDPWWLDKSWKIKNSIERNYKDFVTDIRWQDFEPLRLGDWNTDYNFMKLTALEKNSFNVPISWNILSDMDLYFCENYKIESSNCYWLEILFEMRKTKFRKCLRATLPRKIGDEPTGTCSTILQERDMELRTEGPGIVVKKDEFELSVTDLSYNPKKILSYIPKPSDFWKIRYIFAHLRKGEGTVKVHNYNFLETRKAGFHQIGRPFRTNDGWLCISIYVSMCRNCRMIFMMGGHVIADISFSSEGTWRHIKMYITDSKNSYEQLYVQTIGNELLPQFNYWAIDYVQLCQGKVNRVANLALVLPQREELIGPLFEKNIDDFVSMNSRSFFRRLKMDDCFLMECSTS